MSNAAASMPENAVGFPPPSSAILFKAATELALAADRQGVVIGCVVVLVAFAGAMASLLPARRAAGLQARSVMSLE